MKPKLFIDGEDLSTQIIKLIVNKYPNGYEYDDIITTQNPSGKNIKVIEVEDIEFIYFIKISIMLEGILESHINKDTPPNNEDFDNYFDDY